jgi:glutathione S-transferase
MITIYAATNFPPILKGVVRDTRAVWAAEELGLAYEIKWLSVMEGEHRADWYAAHSPFQKFPAIDDGDFHLAESGAVVAYLADKAGRLIPLPGTPERAQHDQWMFAALSTIEPHLADIFICDHFMKEVPGVAAFRAAHAERARSRLESLDRVLCVRDYISGPDFQVADIIMAHVLAFIRDETLLHGLEHIEAYRARCAARPACQKALAIHLAGRS